MKRETMWLLIGAGVIGYLMLNNPGLAPATVGGRFRPRPYTANRLRGIPGGSGGYAEQGQGFGMEHRTRYGYDG